MQPGARVGRQLGEAPLDRGVDVFVGGLEIEAAGVQLALDLGQTLLEGPQLAFGEEPRRRQAASVGARAGDVVGVELVVELQRAGKGLQLGQQAFLEPAAPKLAPLPPGEGWGGAFTHPRP